ncbi:MAG: PAS domain-containing protein [Candidatus Margulisbacteria bacterium]|nr:PAS domain-containing protein [Candidatus Margulisiibacteriota bacterium]
MEFQEFSDGFFKGLLNHLADGVLVVDGQVVYANRLALHIFGYDEDSISNKSIQDLFSGIGLTTFSDTNVDDLDLKITVGTRRDKTTFMLEYCLRHLVTHDRTYMVYSFRDISEFNMIKSKVVKMEEILKRKQKELDVFTENANRMVLEKTANLREANSELRRAFQELKEKEGKLIQKERWVSIGQLSAGVAHEINNPLGFVQNNLFALQLYVSKFTQMMGHYHRFLVTIEDTDHLRELRHIEEELSLDAALKDLENLFSQTQEGIKRMSDIVKSLKNFSHLEKLVDQSLFDINAGLANTLVICQNEHKYHAIVDTSFGDIPLVICDAGKISQVFLNLIINACQAIKETFDESHHGLIKISTSFESGHVYCRISDNGPGISKEIQRKIFDPFFTTKNPQIGTGLGLSLSYDIIQKHNGELYVESEIGEGATFVLKLPV